MCVFGDVTETKAIVVPTIKYALKTKSYGVFGGYLGLANEGCLQDANRFATGRSQVVACCEKGSFLGERHEKARPITMQVVGHLFILS